MTALSANAQSLETREGWHLEAPVKAAEIIYKGSPVFINSSGYAYSPDGTTNTITVGDVFLGYAYEKADNSSGSNGTIKCRIIARGLVKVPLAGSPTQAKVGQMVYVNNTSDDSTATLTPDMDTMNTPVGLFAEYIDSSYGFVSLDGFIGMRAGNALRGIKPNDEGKMAVQVLKFTYDFSVDGGAQGAITLGAVPSGTVILGAKIDIRTTLTSGGMATIALSVEAANDIKTATAVASWSAGNLAPAAGATFGTATVKTTAARNVQATIATADLTAGVFDLYLVVANY